MPDDALPLLVPEVSAEPETMMRGSKMRIYPTPRQAQIMDLWRRRCMQLWNTLLELEQAAYSGENRKSKLGWRSIWAQMVEESHAEAVRVAREGKKRKDGTIRKAPGERKEPPPLDVGMLDKIRREVSEIDPETGEMLPARLFLWEHELQKVMARLKQVPRTEWIGDLPSHAAQSVVKDLIKALQAMLRERRKRATGAGGRDTGFPKFKKNRYAAGSVYFANTQLKFERKPGAPGRATPKGEEFARVKLPNGVGWMECRMNRQIGAAHDYGEAALMGGRIWRRGEDWYISCQWKVPRPAPLPPTGRVAGIKIAAAIPITIYDDRGQTFESSDGKKFNGVPLDLPPIDRKLLADHKQAGQHQARALEARKARAKKREAYAKKRLAQKQAKGLAVKEPRRARIPLSPGFYRAAARLATLEARDADVREEWLHQITTAIVKQFDVIAVQKMEVARMMKMPKPAEDEEEAAKPAAQGKRRSLKAARVMMRRTAMARIQTTLKYKATDLRGPQAYEELDTLYPTVQPCSRCGVIHPEMKAGKPIMRCAEPLPDGTICGNHLTRNRNAARIVARELGLRLKQREETA